MAVEEKSTRFSDELLSYADTPWYRDVRVLRVLAQIVFAFLFVGALIILINNLISNLNASNIPLNFNIYSAPFTVAVSEGPSITTEWEWLQDIQTIERAAAIFYGLVFLVIIYALWRSREYLLNTLTAIRHQLNVLWRGYRERQRAIQEGRADTSLNLKGARASYDAARSREERRREARLTAQANYMPTFLLIASLLLLIWLINALPPSEIPTALNELFYGGSMARAFVTGIANTIRVVVASLIATTLLGILAGVGLLSGNFLVRTVAQVYVEVFRNTPLIVQLLFIFRTLTLLLPRPIESIFYSDTFGPILTSRSYLLFRPLESILPGSLFERIPAQVELFALNTRGLYMARPEATTQFGLFALFTAIGVAAYLLIRRWRINYNERTGAPANVLRYGLPVVLGFMLVGWLLTGGWPITSSGPLTMEYPALVGRQIEGGTHMTTAFVALFLGLTLYTGAFIADIVRAGIQAVPYGQIEAARSQGFSGTQVLQLIILPQALRLIIPPLGNQYVNLSKNSSLGLAVTYVDTFLIARLANNESGQAVPFFVGLMVIYLALSLILSVLTNLVNRSTRIRTR